MAESCTGRELRGDLQSHYAIFLQIVKSGPPARSCKPGDPEAKAWVSETDVPGLVIETSTLAEFEALMRALIPEMLADHNAGGGVTSIEWTSRGAFELEAA
jgi:hypothetical protein